MSSVSSVKKTSSAVSTLLKTTALAIPFALSPLAAHAYVAIGSTYVDNAGNTYYYAAGADANPAGTYSAAGTKPLDYFNPGNKSYDDKTRSSGATDENGEPILIDRSRMASPIAIGYGSNAKSYDGRAGVALGDYANASDGLGVAIGAYARSDKVGATAIGTASRAGGVNSLAMMRQAAANGNYSVAIGSVSWAQGESSFAMGASATAKGDQSIAIGNVLQQSASASGTTKTKYNGLDNTQSNGVRSVAIGSGAKTNGDDSFAFGSAASTGKFKVERDTYLNDSVTNPDVAGVANKAIAFGTTANATGNASIAFGANSLGAETNSIAFGVEAKARKADAIAFGSNANASEANAIAFGSNAKALHENVITIGKDSKATKKGAMTIGEGAQSNANNSLALGNGTIINQEDIKNKNAKYTNDGFEIENGVVAIANKGKERRLVNLAAGREDTDAVNVKQLSEVNDNLAKSIAGPTYNGYTVDGNGRYTYKAPDFEIKNQTLHTVKEAVELAQTNYVSVKSTIDPKTAGTGSNYDNKGAQGAGSIALGESTGTNAAAVDSVAIGHNTKVNGNNTVAIGANITAATNGSVILGDSSKADGSHATKTVASKEIDGHTYNFAGKAKDAGRFVSVGEKGNERQIKNVAAGHVEADSTDAINGSQLYAVASRVEQGWKITAAKTGTGEVSGNAEKKVAMGDTVTFTAGDNIKITQNEKNLTVATKENVTFTNVTTGNTSLDDKGLTIKNGPSVTKDGVNAGNKKITNVEDGKISADSKDAVNGSQLHATNQNVTNNANNIANNAQNITKNAQNITKNAENIAKGLNFKGDNADVTVNRQLGETLNVTGGADKEQLTDNNIGVIGEKNSSAATGGLAIKLAKDLKGLNSVETKQIKLGDNSSNTTIKYEGDRIKYGDKTVANLDDEKHITNTTYAVGNDGNVSLTYTDGKGNVVNGMTATITGVAKNDLSNINKAGETKIQNLAKDAIGMENGENTVASHRDVNGVKTFKVDVKGDLANITSITGGANTGKVEFAGDQVVNVAGDNPIKLDAKTGDITGLTNKTLDGADFGKKGRAATEEQLKIVNDSKIGDNNIRLAGNSGKTADQKLSKQDGIEFNVVGGDNAKYVTTTAAGANVTVDLTQDTKDKIDNAANKDLSNITNEGKKVITGLGTIVEAADSSVTVTNSTDAVGRTTYKVKANVPGADAFNIKYKANGANDQTVALTEGLDFTNGNFTTASVAANGVVKYDVKTGEIENGANGKDGKSVDISTNDGTQTLVNQEPGTDKSQRIVYTPKDKDGNPIKGKDGKDIVREVATMDDGLKFAGDDGQTDDSKVIAKKLNQKIDIVGGADKTKLTENNIGVNNKDGKLNVQLSKDINLTNDGSIKFGDNNLNINKDGLTITGGPSVTKTGIDGGNKQIKNVAEGTEDNDAVTVKQLRDSKTALVNGKNTSVTGTGTKADPYKVNVEGALKDITSITNKDGNGKVEFAADQVVNVAGDNPIKLDAKTGDITGLTNKDLNGPTYAKAGRAATEEQLEAKGTQITNNLTAKGLNFGAQSGDVIHKDLGEKLDIVGEGTKADDRYDATNIKTMTKDGKVVIGLAKDLTADKVTVGQKGEPGKDGVDGQIGVNGKDGSAVVLNGKDGSIGLNGENGKNGVSIKGDQGPAGVDGKAGETKNRIVYEYKDPKDPNKTIKEDVATLNDGLKFKGDKGDSIAKKLNEELEILGKLDPNAAVTDKNLRVDNDAGKLVLKMAKQLQDLTSATFIDETTDNKSVINGNGLTVTPKDADNTKTVSVTDKGLNNGGNQIVNVDSGLKKADGTKVELKDAEGDTLNNAVNVGDLKAGVAQATTKVAAGKNVNVTSDKNPDGSTTYTVATKDDVDFTSVTTGKTTMNDGGITIKATEGGKTNVTLTNKGLDNGGNKVVNVAEGTNDTDAVNVKQLKAAKTEVEAGDNVVVTSNKGSNGQTIYKVNATDNSAHVDGSDAITVTKAPTTRKNGTTTVTDYKVDLSNKTKDDINKGVDAHDTVNNKGLTFNADKGTTGVKKLGSQVAVNGDNKNIETVADANGVKVKLKDDISVNSVTAKTIKAGDTTINDNGLTIKNGPSVTKDGINAGGSRITNVAPGRDGTDAVNVNQLKKATNEIHNSLNKMDKRRKAGTASALAAAGLMQAYREGQSSVTAGVGQYQNQSAVAVGYSRLSDNGKYGVKVSFITNTQGEVGGTASAGYFW